MTVGITWNQNVEQFSYYIKDLKLISSKEELTKVSLLIFPGGQDISPSIYGGDKRLSFEVNESRDYLERVLYGAAVSLKIPILAVCRGSQLLNALLERSNFIQDLRYFGYVEHPYKHKLDFKHKDNYMYDFFGKKEIVSTHHQGVLSSPSIKIAEYEGVTEITFYKDRKILTTQFHPEFERGNGDFFNWLVEEYSKTGTIFKDNNSDPIEMLKLKNSVPTTFKLNWENIEPK